MKFILCLTIKISSCFCRFACPKSHVSTVGAAPLTSIRLYLQGLQKQHVVPLHHISRYFIFSH